MLPIPLENATAGDRPSLDGNTALTFWHSIHSSKSGEYTATSPGRHTLIAVVVADVVAVVLADVVALVVGELEALVV
jgi:hypothetical protein